MRSSDRSVRWTVAWLLYTGMMMLSSGGAMDLPSRSSRVDLVSPLRDVARRVARVDDQPGVAHDEIVVVARVVGDDEHAVLGGEKVAGEGPALRDRQLMAPRLGKRG